MQTLTILSSAFVCSLMLKLSLPVVPTNKPVTVEKKWETPATLKTPESILFPTGEKVGYVSNINGKATEKDGNGFISKIGIDGNIIDLEWVKGLNAPKGMAIFKDKLYVADISQVVIIDIKTKAIAQTIDLADASFLNDVTVDSKGNVYVSDSDKNRIYRISDGKASVWLQVPDVKRLNGLLALEDKMLLADSGSGFFYSLDYQTQKLTKIAEGMGHGDGISEIAKNEYFVSNWAGEVFHVSPDGKTQKVIDTKAEMLNAADIQYIPSQKLLLVPTFNGNKITAYTVK